MSYVSFKYIDTFEFTGIGFENLNNDHITNIQMYGV